jgi:hypothetical protein
MPIFKPVHYDTTDLTGLPSGFPNSVMDGDWEQYLPPYLGQLFKFESAGCTQISAIYYCLGAYANYLLKSNQWPQEALDFFNQNGYIVNGSFQFSWEFNACLDGTSINGNIAQNAWKSASLYGLIPLSMLQMTITESEQFTSQAQQDAYYYNPVRVTPEMHALGKQSRQYFTLAWKWVGDGTATIPLQTLQNALQTAPIQLAIPVPAPTTLWNQNSVPYTGSKVISHCDCMYNINATTGYPFEISDSYIPQFKNLMADYYIPIALQGIMIPTDFPQGIPQPKTFIQTLVQNLTDLWNYISLKS